MARIRSIHPSLFTDETFMSLSMSARMFMVGLWCEADDHGVFEWKPLTLKARIFPADQVDAKALLAELQEVNIVRAFSVGDRHFGAIRNFCKYQKPRRPTYLYPLAGELHVYVRSDGSESSPAPDNDGNEPGSSEPIPDNVRNAPDNVRPEMEIGVGEGKGEGKEDPSLRSGGESAPAKPSRGTRLPADWQPSQEDIDFAVSLGIEDIPETVSEFRDYWHPLPGKDALKLDWSATWRNNCRRAAKRPPRNRQAQAPPRREERGTGWLAAAQEVAGEYEDRRLG